MKMFKFFGIIVALAVIGFSLASCATGGGTHTPERQFRWERYGDGKITAYTGRGGVVLIPPQIQGMPVVGIGVFAFAVTETRTLPDGRSIEVPVDGGRRVTGVSIPGSVTFIGFGAFAHNQLTSVNIPGSVTSIGADAFGSNQLTSVIIPDSVISIGGAAFQNNRLIHVTISNNLTEIERSLFFSGMLSGNQLSNVIIPVLRPR